MGKADYRTASDGHTARVAPAWTEEKLRVLASYLNGFAHACKGHPAGWYALDAFAGAGVNTSQLSGGEIHGSALIALEAGPPPARQVAIAEKDSRVLAALTSRVSPYGERAKVFPGDANVLIGDMLALIPRNAPTFAFLDPEGSELAWTTVEAIAAHKAGRRYKVEQLILLPTDMGFVRMLPIDDDPSPQNAEHITSMYGHDRWRAIYKARRAGRLTPIEARDQYVELYKAGLSALGYAYVEEREIAKEGTKGAKGAPMYFLIHATDNATGHTIMNWCFDKKHVRVSEEAGQIPMITLPVAPRRKRQSTEEDA